MSRDTFPLDSPVYSSNRCVSISHYCNTSRFCFCRSSTMIDDTYIDRDRRPLPLYIVYNMTMKEQ